MDIKKGDKIEYSYYALGVECSAYGTVASVREDGSVTIDRGENELVIEKGNIIKRFPRPEELEEKKVEAPVNKTEEERFNEIYKGISLHKKEPEKQTFNKKNNSIGEK